MPTLQGTLVLIYSRSPPLQISASDLVPSPQTSFDFVDAATVFISSPSSTSRLHLDVAITRTSALAAMFSTPRPPLLRSPTTSPQPHHCLFVFQTLVAPPPVQICRRSLLLFILFLRSQCHRTTASQIQSSTIASPSTCNDRHAFIIRVLTNSLPTSPESSPLL